MFIMFYTIAIDLLALWLLGLLTSYTLGGIIYILPAIAIVMILVNIISEQRLLQSTIESKIVDHNLDKL